MTKVAVVLFNMGGPDRPEAVQPFLFNLFNDPAIIGAPGPLRWLLARFISSRRAPVARGIYARIGGRSPLIDMTRDQARALQEHLNEAGDVEARVFVAMRYWHPRAFETALEVRDWRPDEIVALPLYPQYSTTTNASSLKDWREAAEIAGLKAPTRSVCCYPLETGWIEALTELARRGLEEAAGFGRPRLLFSAHGLPKKVVAKGDPYQEQVERTAEAVVARLGIDGLDWTVCYQSRVGPLEWIGPSTETELERSAHDKVPVVVVPVAFVSEHSETLVELDIEYREEAERLGVPGYVRVPTVATHPAFIGGLARTVRKALTQAGGTLRGDGQATCGAQRRDCPHRGGR